MKCVTSSGWLLLCLLTVIECGDQKVIGFAGQNVTLPCKYDITKHGSLSVCWGRQAIPFSGCPAEIISTDGRKVSRQSDRYQLLGWLDAGDVSLTILNTAESDSGQYGCRVHVIGWLNDKKYHVDLTIQTVPETTTSTTSDNVTSTEETPSHQDHMNSTEYWDTSSPRGSQTEAQESSSHLSVVLVCVLFAVVVLVTAVTVMIAKRWRLNKIPQIPQRSSSSMRFRPSVSSLGLHSRGSAVENIYQIEESNDYESCP